MEPSPRPSLASRLLALLLVGAAAAFTLYAWRPDLFRPGATRPGPAPATAPSGIYYCPMHPQQRSDKPGNCPICGMKMVKQESGAASSSSDVFLAPRRQQMIGVRSEPAAFRSLAREIRTVGRVAQDETRISHIHTKVAGFIEHVYVDYVGRQVRRGEPLFTIYSPELVATEEEYLLALKSARAMKDSQFPWIARGSANLLEAAGKRLRLWDVSEDQIAQLEKSGQPIREITIHSPVSGVVTERAAYHHGRYVTPETDLYTIVDLTSVWVIGEVFEADLPLIRVGQMVEVEFPFATSDRVRSGRIVFVAPSLNAQSRTGQVRLEFANPDLSLKPDMFVDFTARVALGTRLAVPEDAVLDTGSEQYVFVDQGEGYFQPRRVRPGAAAGGWREIQAGLRAGERVVTTANFLLDSESRLKGALAGLGGEPAPPAKGGHAGH